MISTGIKDGVLYIHTTYLDNINNLDETFLKEAEATKKYDPIKYARDFEGKWLKESDKSFLTQQLLKLALEPVDEVTYDQIVVAIDPAVSTNKNSDATGIAVCARKNNHYYVLHVEENKWTPEQWSNKAKELYDKYNANFIVYESNQGGDMVEHTLRNVLGNFVRIKSVRATQGKLIRFEPVLALYEQQLVHHLGRFTDLEYQLLTYSGSAKDSSPNCVDAEVWAITSLNQTGTSCYTFA